MVRVAAIQCGAGTDRADNLATCRRLLAEAAAKGAQLAVLPEFANHASWYDDQEHAWQVAVEPGDDFLTGIADAAAEFAMWVVVNATRRDAHPTVRGANFLFGPTGELVAVADKQVLMGAESDHLSPAVAPAPIVDTSFAPMSLYSCMDGVINETPRGLALRGALILTNCLNSFAEDEASLHIPVRAAENRVWVVAANKVGPLIPPDAIQAVSERMGIPVEKLHGAGEAQIVAPDGTVVARGPRTGQAVVIADIDPDVARDKTRPDGTDLFASRRPELYGAIAREPAGRTAPPGPDEVIVAAVNPIPDVAMPPSSSDLLAAIADAVSEALAGGAQLICLPELAGLPVGKDGWPGVTDPNSAASVGRDLVDVLRLAVAGTPTLVATTVVEATEGGVAHTGVLVGADGVVLRQRQLHACGRHPWVTIRGDLQEVADTRHGRVTLVVGGDDVFPETFRLAVLQDAEVALVPTHVTESWEVTTGLLERSAENRMCLVAATRPGVGSSLICTLERDFTLWTEWADRAFDGRISHPIVTRAAAGDAVTVATVHPARTVDRILTRRTDVVDSRPWWLAGALVTSPPTAALPVASSPGA